MKEELQIYAAAELADHDAPEKLSGERAGSFVDSVLKAGAKNNTKYSRKAGLRAPVFKLSALAVGFAAAAVLAVVFLTPSDRISPGYGDPAQLMEMESSHATMEVLDSLDKSSSDTLVDTQLPVMDVQ